MKKRLLCTLIAIISTISLKAQENLDINISKSSINWSCDYTFYFGGHYGTVDFKDGYFTVKDNQIIGGEFIIDMDSITSTDIEEEESNESLVNHLKNDDFFDVKKNPTATLTIKETTYHDHNHLKITADLTIMGITKSVWFQAEINHEEKYMTTRFKIDRTRWGVTYNSNVKDSAISDAIGFEVKLSL